MKEIADSKLLELNKQSSYPVFNELYLRYWKYIYTIAYKKLGDKDDAADLTQNLFMELYQKREHLNVRIPVKTIFERLYFISFQTTFVPKVLKYGTIKVGLHQLQ